MKKISIILLMLVAISAMVFVGCSDDEATTVAAAATAQGWIIGGANVEPDLSFYADVFPITNNTFNIDSVVVGDSLAQNDDDNYWYVYGDGNYDYVWYNNNADSTRYYSGDTCDITFYKNGTSTTCSVKLLDEDDDEIAYILPIHNDTISLGTSLSILWNSVPNADWYGVRIQYYKDSAGTYSSSDRRYYSQTDTTISIPASTNIYNGYYNIYVVSVTGPGEGDPPNINGAGLKGEIHSETDSQYRRVYVGTGDPTPVGGQEDIVIEDARQISREIISAVRNHPKKEVQTNHQ